VLREHTAGSPQDEGIRWTDLRPREIAQRISEVGISVSRKLVRKLMAKHKFRLRQSQKKKSFKQDPDRNTQFERISELKSQYLKMGQPVISIDTKKKELLGNFYRNGKLYTQKTIEVLDHDFPSYGQGKVVPHGIYDVCRNKAHINLGTSRDTTEFACDSLAHWWEIQGQHAYPDAQRLLILCDGGGSNPSQSPLFQQDLQALANRIGLEIRIAHYPSYCSKHNPIEHRVFCHVTRACEGVVFDSVATVRQLMEKTHTQTGLGVTVDVLDKIYEAGRKAAEHVKSTLKIVRDTILPKWNYTLSPQEAPA
jgi:DDE family transposase